MTKQTVRIGVLVGLVVLMLPCLVHAQIIAGLTLEKLGILSTPGTGARPYAMGGAYTAVSDDAFGLLYNPAGLAEIRRREITIGLHARTDDITNTYGGLHAEKSSSNTSLGHAAVVYPYPTFRGSLVLAFGVFRVGSSDMQSLKNASLADIPATVENMYTQSGNIYQYHLGLGVDISPQIAAGVSLVLWDEGIEFTDEINYADADSQAFWRDDVSMNLDGYSFNMGLLFRPTDATRIGLSFTSPAWLSYNGDGVTTYDGTYTSGGGWTTEPDHGIISEDYTLPMRFTGGGSARFAHLLLAADLSYCDYSQTEYNGLVISDELDPARAHIFDATWSYHVGAELSLPQAPVCFRGGFSYVPLELSTVEEIAYISFDTPTSRVASFDMNKERRFFTFGVGGLIDKVLQLDLGVSIGGYEKVTTSASGATVFSEKQDITEIVVSGTYRF
jgi:long-subunit fatty acid transport protein